MHVIGKALLALAAAGIGILLLLHQRETRNHAEYATSGACQDCHQEHFRDWRTTLHPMQFRPVSADDELLGDFASDDPALTFTREEVEFVVGNRYEQVYARRIGGEYYPLPAKWYVKGRKWVPYKVKDWRKTPLSTKCNGCHTTGFDAETLEFAEYGIGCEACHGPGAVHVQNRRMESGILCAPCHGAKPSGDGDIVVSVNGAVCGQCHSRGVQFKDAEHLRTSYNFPVGFQPDQELPQGFQQTSPEQDKKGKYWWGMGLSKKRHQEFADFNLSKHSKSLRNLHEKHSGERGEKNDECLLCHSADYRLAPEGERPTLDTAKQGITCVVCHDPHNLTRGQHEHVNPGQICGECHADGLSFHAAETGRPHYPCPVNKVTCPDCHMPYIVKSGGGYHLRSHAFRIVRPADTRGLDMPNSCQNGGCHADQDLEWAEREFAAFYPQALAE